MNQDRYIELLPGPEMTAVTNDNPRETRQRQVDQLRLLWNNRLFLLRSLSIGILLSLVVTLLIPVRYEAKTQLMPPDGQSSNPLALMSAITGKAGPGALGGLAGNILGLKNSGALFIGVVNSRTVQDSLIRQFDLMKVYRTRRIEDARKVLTERTSCTEDRKSGIISVTVTDHSAQRAAAMAQAYVTQLDKVIAQVSTSSARRERIFLEERLKSVKSDLDEASKNFSQFASRNAAIDITAQGKAMVEAAAVLQGQLIFAQSELQGLEAIYTDQNIRVRTLRARVAELNAQLQRLGGDRDTAARESSPGGDAKASNSALPSIRKLPLLGVTYFDLYRQTKIQETVYELLTQQYELAKVEEAKEIPSVKVLDAPVVPTKISFPPIGLFWLLGTVLFFAGACASLFVRRSWAAMDPQDPGKVFAEEVAVSLRGSTEQMVAIVAARFRGGTNGNGSNGENNGNHADHNADTKTEVLAKKDQLSRAAGEGND